MMNHHSLEELWSQPNLDCSDPNTGPDTWSFQYDTGDAINRISDENVKVRESGCRIPKFWMNLVNYPLELRDRVKITPESLKSALIRLKNELREAFKHSISLPERASASGADLPIDSFSAESSKRVSSLSRRWPEETMRTKLQIHQSRSYMITNGTCDLRAPNEMWKLLIIFRNRPVT